jgi:hypothetical protein
VIRRCDGRGNPLRRVAADWNISGNAIRLDVRPVQSPRNLRAMLVTGSKEVHKSDNEVTKKLEECFKQVQDMLVTESNDQGGHNNDNEVFKKLLEEVNDVVGKSQTTTPVEA